MLDEEDIDKIYEDIEQILPDPEERNFSHMYLIGVQCGLDFVKNYDSFEEYEKAVNEAMERIDDV